MRLGQSDRQKNVKSRPRIEVQRTALERTLDIIALAALVAMVALLLAAWSDLPDRIPTHFGIDGQPDGWGPRRAIVLLPIIALPIHIVLSALQRVPHIYNFPYAITEENAERQYQLARQFLAAIKAWSLLLLAGIVHDQIRGAHGESMIGLPLYAGSMAVVVLLMIGYFVQARRLR